MSKKRIIIISIAAALILSCLICFAIGLYQTSTPSYKATKTAESLTQTAAPTRTLKPTKTTRPTNTTKPTNTQIPTKTAAPTAASTNTPASRSGDIDLVNPTSTQNQTTYKVTKLTSPVQAGSKATVTIKTQSGANCKISYTTPSGTPSTASGLQQKTADKNGNCTWTWEISSSTNPGTGTIYITVNGTGTSYPIEIK